jgi:hypothetical protein
VAAACSGGTATHPATTEDARGSAVAPRDGGSAAGSSAGSAAVTPGSPGELDVTVTWKDTPHASRASPGRSTCGTPRPASVAPTTMWGIPDVVVFVDGATVTLGEVRIVVADCGLTPRVAVGDKLVLASAAKEPTSVGVASFGLEPEAIDGTKPKDGTPAPVSVMLPIAGHEVVRALDAGIYDVAGDGDGAWVVAKPNAMVTDAAGQAVFRDVPGGPHSVVAWLPARGDQPAKLVTAKATVTAGPPVELTIDLGP